jgi:hypothetical protein
MRWQLGDAAAGRAAQLAGAGRGGEILCWCPQTRRSPARPASEPVELVPADRSHRAVLGNLGQLYHHDLSGPYGHVPSPDGTFSNRRLDLFLQGPTRRPGPGSSRPQDRSAGSS